MIKYCKNCKYFTGVFEHGWNECWGECRKNKNTLHCFTETPCLQNIKNLRKVYYEQKNKISTLECKETELEIFKERYESMKRTKENYRCAYFNAMKFVSKKDQYKVLEQNNKDWQKRYSKIKPWNTYSIYGTGTNLWITKLQ